MNTLLLVVSSLGPAALAHVLVPFLVYLFASKRRTIFVPILAYATTLAISAMVFFANHGQQINPVMGLAIACILMWFYSKFFFGKATDPSKIYNSKSFIGIVFPLLVFFLCIAASAIAKA